MTDRFFWLVEAAGPHYLGALHNRFFWTRDHDAALHLATQAQAEALRDAVRALRPDLFPDSYPMPGAVEHGWLARGLASAKAESERFPEHRKAALDSDTEFPMGERGHVQEKDPRR